MLAGMAMKNTCSCGISRLRMPSPRLKTRPKTMNGALIWTPTTKAPATALIAICAASSHMIAVRRREDHVAVVDRRERHVVEVGRKDQRDAEEAEEAPTTAPCTPPCVGSADCAKLEAGLVGDHRARDLRRHHDEPRDAAEDQPDDDLVAHAGRGCR